MRRSIVVIGSNGPAWLAIFLIIALSFAACGGGEAEKEKEKETPTATGAAAGDLEVYCENFLAIETAEPDIDFETATPEQVTEGAKKFAKEDLRPLADKIVDAAPDEIKEEIDVLNDGVTELERTGDFAVFEKAEFIEADKTVDEYTVENCGWKEVNVTATDYAYGGVSPELEAGVTAFEFENNGTEHHEMVIHRKNDGVTQTFDQLLTLPEDQLEQNVTFFGYADAHPKEEGGHAVADLKPGQYSIICSIPVGSTPEAEKAAEESGKEIEGPPHFTRGMKTEFTVK
jgi:hypothetical protein